MDSVGKYCVVDGTVGNLSDLIQQDEESVLFYEVIRTQNSIPWFFDDHMDRLENGISLRLNHPCHLRDEIKKGIILLTEYESYQEMNLKVSVLIDDENISFRIHFLKSLFPDMRMQEEGVDIITVKAERSDPNVKIYNSLLREHLNKALEETGAYEGLLVNNRDIVTEGSRSNIFFIDADDTVVTSPEYLVLPGVTRKQIISICHEQNIKIVFREIRVNEIYNFRYAFITGTSPMVLPIRSIDRRRYETASPVVNHLLTEYMLKAQQSMGNFCR